MATFYSAQQQLKINLEAGTGYSLASGLNTIGARVHYAFATIYSDPLHVVGSILEMFTLPKGARLISLELNTGALGAGVTLSAGTDFPLVGDAGTPLAAAGPANLLAATSVAAATAAPIAGLQSLNLGRSGLTNRETKVNLTVAGAAPVAGQPVILTIAYAWN